MSSAARLVARPIRNSEYSQISTYMTDILHWLTIASPIQYQELLLVVRTQQRLNIFKTLCAVLSLLVCSQSIWSAGRL